MKTKLVSALGLALLAASLSFSSSFACSQSSEAAISALPTTVPESDATVAAQTSITEVVDQAAEVSAIEPPPIGESAPVTHSVDAIVVEITRSGTIMALEAIDASEAAQTSITEEVDQPATVSTIEPSPTVESAPVIHSADAIVIEITQSVTIVAPEAIAACEPDATVAVQAGTEGSIAALDEPAPVVSTIEPSPIDASTPSTIRPADAIVVEITQSVTVAAQGQKSEDNEEMEHTGSTSSDHAATEPASIPDTETLALDGVN